MPRPLICLLASKDTTAGVLYGLYDVLGNVGPDYEDMLGGTVGESKLDVRIVARSLDNFDCLSGIPVQPQAGIEDIEHADAIVVCDMYTPVNSSPLGRYPEEVKWLRQMYARDTLLCSVCSGSALLAESGLLNGLEVSSHWAYRHMFRKYFPKTVWSEGPALNLSAEKKRLITTAGVTTWHDLSIYLIERFCGLQQAVGTARVYLLAQHTDGQLPFAAMTQNNQHSDAIVSECQTWISEHYDCINPVTELVQRSGLSARTLSRRFRAATGYQPIEYVQGMRIEVAKQLLESNSQNIEQVSNEVGYNDPTSFRRLFKRNVGISPSAYRKKFCSIVSQG